MDVERFDVFTRKFSSADSSRRQALRALGSLLFGGALGGVVSQLGLTESAAAKSKKQQKTKSRRQRKPQAERKGHGQLQAQGKHHKKHKNNHHDKPKDPSSPPPSCGTGEFRCSDGSCIGIDSGQCCPDDKRCVDPESSSGFSCIPMDGCCPDQKKCGGGCVYRQVCCPDERPQCGACGEVYCDMHGDYHCTEKCCSSEKQCPDGTCVAKDACCPGETRCDDSSCVGIGQCCPGEHQCPDTTCAPVDQCCLGERRCDDGSCIPDNQCCPEVAPPVCGECEVAKCVAGSWDCWPDDTCGDSCGEGFCPKGMYCDHIGTCCGTPDGGTYWTCVCASGYTGGAGCTANGQCCRKGCCYPYCCEDPRAS
jgi:hypothetical protein